MFPSEVQDANDIHMLRTQRQELIVIVAVERDARFLGCDARSFESTAGDLKELLEWHPSYHRRQHLTKQDCNGEFVERTMGPNRKVLGKVNDMQSFGYSCIDNHCELGPSPRKSSGRSHPLHRRDKRSVGLRNASAERCGAL